MSCGQKKAYVIVGQDTDGSVTPVDLGMDWIVSKKKDFIGKRSLSRSDTDRPNRKQLLVGLKNKIPPACFPREPNSSIHLRLNDPFPWLVTFRRVTTVQSGTLYCTGPGQGRSFPNG